jgi:hypothetical protein
VPTFSYCCHCHSLNENVKRVALPVRGEQAEDVLAAFYVNGVTLYPTAPSSPRTRDLFDRLIVGNAFADGADLLGADRTVRAHLRCARWPAD